MISAFASHARRRAAAVRADGGDRGSLVLALLVTLVATSVAALLLPLLVTSANSARLDDRRARQLSAAQSGVETALARIRAAMDSSSNGSLQKLPCSALTGAVLGDSTLRYNVQIAYYKTDPTLLKTTADLANATITCLTDVVGGLTASLFPTTPSYARITAQGTDAPGNTFTTSSTRTVSATYVVKTTNSNIVGGLFRVNKLSTSKDLCIDAGDAPFVVGRVVTMQKCDATRAAQKWAYNTSLTVSLVATRTLDANGNIVSDGLCIDGGLPEKSGAVLALQACGIATNLTQQRWSMNDNAGMQGTDDGASLNGYCWAVANPDNVSSTIVLGTQCSAAGGGYDNKVSWQPEAAVGAGASGAAYNELVNYAQFGRCLDVTNQNTGSSYLIAWPCKQNPDPTKVAWNQRWSLPTITNGTGTGRITTTVNNTTYCLNSPLSSASGNYITVTACPASTTVATTWTVRTKVSTYAASYQVESTGAGAGLCMQPTDPSATPPDLAAEGTGISKIVLASCSPSTLQKWNAPPNIDAPSVKDQTEN